VLGYAWAETPRSELDELDEELLLLEDDELLDVELLLELDDELEEELDDELLELEDEDDDGEELDDDSSGPTTSSSEQPANIPTPASATLPVRILRNSRRSSRLWFSSYGADGLSTIGLHLRRTQWQALCHSPDA
jgi:hypothetical protein